MSLDETVRRSMLAASWVPVIIDSSPVVTVPSGPITFPAVQITVTTNQLFFVQGMGVDTGGSVVRPVTPVPIGTSLWPLTSWTLGTALFYAFALAYSDSMTLWNDDGSFGGSGGFMFLYESDDPSVYEPQDIVTTNFIATEMTFEPAAAAVVAHGSVPITSLLGFNLP